MTKPKKKVLIITTDLYHPLRHRIHNILDDFIRTFDVYIVATLPFGANTDSEKSYSELKNQIVTIKSIKIPCVTFIKSFFTIRKILKDDYFDVCLVIAPYLGFITLINRVNCPVIYEDTDRFAYFTDNLLLRWLKNLMEQYCIKKADHVISVGYTLCESAKSISKKNNVSCIPNGVDYNLFSKFYTENKQNKMVYVGTVEKWAGLDLVVETLPVIKKEIPDIKLVIIGDGTYMNELIEKAKILNVQSHIECLGKIKYSDIPQIISKAKIGLAVYPNNELMKYAFTLKIIEYMAAGLPVITTNVGDGAQIVKKFECGIVIDYNMEMLITGVIKLMKNKELIKVMSNNGITFSKKYNWSNLAYREIDVINNVIDNVRM